LGKKRGELIYANKSIKKYFDFLKLVKIRTSWLNWRILPLKKNDDILSHISGEVIFEKKNVRFLSRSLSHHGLFCLFTLFLYNLWGVRVKACYFLDLENLLQKKGQKDLYTSLIH
jgi:hypothetical protein